MATLQIFRDRADLSRFLVEATSTEKAMRDACIAGADRLACDPQKVALCRMARALFNEHCDAANATVASEAELAIIDADIAELMPRVRALAAAGVVVDLATLEKLMNPEPVD